MSTNVRRLYESFQPNHYDLALELNRELLHFSGTVVIKGKKTGRPSQRLTFHQNGLKVTAASIIKHDKKGDQPLEISRINTQDTLNEVRLHAENMIYPGEYTVTLAFEADITRGMTGIYPCFFNHEGAEHVLLATQFESHHAREAFPCIDEPEAKATFNMTLLHDKDLVALGNTPVEEAKVSGALQKTTFKTTPKMSAYLLAFVVGELHAKKGQTARGTDVNIWATTAQPANSLDYALEVATGCIEFFETFFGVQYPLAKADHVALPDFSAGAMENWGLITYREAVLLLYPEQAAQSTREQIALVIAHETSHQWFGNLVTMKWWNDLWLNESFANMMEYQAIDALYPDWHIWNTFVASEGLSALRRDSIFGVQAVKTAVHHPDEISTLFDPSIVYAKGGRLLYMLKNYIGDEAFRNGLKTYFETHAYGNTEGADLWAALSDASGKDVAAFMDPWLERSGFPVISVEQDGKKLSINQQHFLDNPSKTDKDRRWPVPLFTLRDDAPATIEKASQTAQLTSDEFVILNQAARGHYIVRYTSDAHKKFLIDKISSKALSEPDRLMLLNSGVMLAKAGYEPFGNVLMMLEAYKAEDSETVWDMISLVLADAKRFVDQDDSLEQKLKALIATLITPQFKRLGWEESKSDSVEDQKLRATIIALGAYAEQSDIIAHSLELFENYKADENSVSGELRGIVFGVAVKEKANGALDYLLDLHAKTYSSDLQRDIAGAVTSTRDTAEAEKLLSLITDAQKVKPQDADRWLFYMLRNRYIRETSWDWMVAHWDWIETTYEKDKSYDYFPRYCANICNTRKLQQRYKEFFEPKADNITLKRNISIGLEEIDSRLIWLERDLAGVQAFFK